MWQVAKLEELTAKQLYAIYKLRTDVFVVEQNCAYPEVDAADLVALHGMKWEDGQLVAYYRLIPDEHSIHLGRVVVNPAARKGGQGRELVAHALQVAAQYYPTAVVHAQAQAYLEQFYASFGFEPISDVYLEDGIPHLDMELHL